MKLEECCSGLDFSPTEIEDIVLLNLYILEIT